MKLIIVAKIRNESDILETFVRYHAPLAARILILNHRSQDNSAEILKKLQAEGLPLDVEEDPSLAHQHGAAMTRLMRAATRRYQPDWILPLDEDEFLVGPQKANLTQLLASFAPDHTVALPWKTYIPRPQDLATEQHVLKRLQYRKKKEALAFFKILIPRSLACLPETRIVEGSHHLLLHETPVPATPSENLALAHFPVRSPLQIRQKILAGWPAHVMNPDKQEGQAFHWKNLFDILKQGHVLSPEDLQTLALNYTGQNAASGLVQDPVAVAPHAALLRYPAVPIDPVTLLAESVETLAKAVGEKTRPAEEPHEPTNKYAAQGQQELNPDLVAMVGKNRKVLELGCNTGYMSKAFAANGCRVTGVDILAAAATEASRYCERVISGDVETLDWERCLAGETFDVMVFADILEHLKNPAVLLEKLRPFLHPKGQIVLRVPNIAHVSVRLELLEGRFEYEELGLLDNTHLRFFTQTSLIRLLQTSGFYSEKIHPIHHLIPEAVIRQRLERIGGHTPELVRRLVRDEAQIFEFLILAGTDAAQENFGLSGGSKVLEEARSYMSNLKEYMAGLELHLANLHEHVKDKHAQITDLHRTLAEEQAKNETLANQMSHELAYLRDYVQGVQRSLVWRMLTHYDRLMAAALPPFSRRRIVYDRLLTQLKHLLGMHAVPKSSANPVETAQPKPVFPAWPAALPKFQGSGSPHVSIIMLVHNQKDLTHQCLKSVEAYTPQPYEIIVIDNASDKPARDYLRQIQGIRLIRNETNNEYAKGCNQATAEARAPFLLFLNNDTVVTENWLPPLLQTLKARPHCGAVAAKLVGFDGKLQEAGGILWQNGSGMAYGRGDEAPEKPEYGYAREVDYVSGACLLTQRDLFKKLGGFDEAYGMYYEDVDYCVTLQEAGYQVYYQPASTIYHRSFGSSSRDKGFKRILANRLRFLEKHAAPLQKRLPPPAEETSLFEYALLGRERQRLPAILYLDDRIPAPEQGSGYGRAFKLLETLRELNYRVTLLPLDQGTPWQPHTATLQQMGVEVFFGTPVDFKAWARTRQNFYDIIIVSRAGNFANTIATLRQCFPAAAVLYDAECIFSERAFLKASLAERPDARLIKTAATQMEDEIRLVSAADGIISVGPQDAARFQATGKPVYMWPVPNVTRRSAQHFQTRRDLLFVGGFLSPDSPNTDALLYYRDKVMPHLPQADFRLKIVGTHIPASIQALASDKIQVLGYAPQLQPLFDAHRVFVVPHQLAAGISCKLLEAMAHGIPAVISQRIAAQSGLTDGVEVLIAKNAQEFAAKITRLYEDEELWAALQKNAYAYIERTCHPDLLRQEMDEILRKSLKIETANTAAAAENLYVSIP